MTNNCIECQMNGMCLKANEMLRDAWNLLEEKGDTSEEYKAAQKLLDDHLAATQPEAPGPVNPAEEPTGPPVDNPVEDLMEEEEEEGEAEVAILSDAPAPEPESESGLSPLAPVQMVEMVSVHPPTETVTMEAHAEPVKTVETDDVTLQSAEELGFLDYAVPDLFDRTRNTGKKYRYWKDPSGETKLVGIFGEDATLLPNNWVHNGVEKWRAQTPELQRFQPPAYSMADFQLIEYLSYAPMAQTAGGFTCEVAVVVKNSENCTLGYSVTGLLRFLDANGKEVAATPTRAFSVFRRKHTKGFNPKPEEAAEMTRGLVAEANHIGPKLTPVATEMTATHAYVLTEIIRDSKFIPHVYLPEYMARFRKTKQNRDPDEWSEYRCTNDPVWRSNYGIPDSLLTVFLDLQRSIWISKGIRENGRLVLAEAVNDHFAVVSTFAALLGDN